MENPQIPLLTECINTLETALHELCVGMPKPEFNPEEGNERFRFAKIDPYIFVILKGVRVISGLNASISLLEKGFVQEIGVITRTIIEFLNDITFIQGGLNGGKFSEHQQEMLDIFFKDDVRTAQELMASDSKRPGIIRRKIYAALSKFFNPHNPYRAQKIVKIGEDVFSGYVHGCYPHIMELYSEPGGFQLEGTSERIPEGVKYLAAFCIHPALNTFIVTAKLMGNKAISEMLQQQRLKLEKNIKVIPDVPPRP
jgi:hypothetical protein